MLLDAAAMQNRLAKSQSCITEIEVDCTLFQDDPAAAFTGLSPFSTRLTSIQLYNLGPEATISAISPLIVASLAFHSLTSLSLTLSCDSLDGLFTTIASCCPKLQHLQIFRDGNDYYDDELGGFPKWNVQHEDMELLLSRVPLRTMTLEQCNVVDKFDMKKDDQSDSPFAAQLKGVSLIRCTFKRDFVRLLTLSAKESLVYFELVNDLEEAWGDEAEEEREIGDIISMLAEYNSQTLKNLCLHGTRVKDAEVKAISVYFRNLKRLSLGDAPLLCTGQAFKFLSRTVLNKLEVLHLISAGGEREFEGASTRNIDLSITNSDDHFLAYFDTENELNELIIMGFDDISPSGVGAKLTKLRELHVGSCQGFTDPAEVCRLCRANESLVIKNVKLGVVASGSFDCAMFDCEGEKEDEEEQAGEANGEEK